MAQLSREELEAQLAALDDNDRKLRDMANGMSNRVNFDKSKSYKGTKIAVAAIVVFLAVIGTLGSMKWGIFSSFDMDSFVKFLSSYQGIFITLTSSVGIGGIVKNVLKSKNGQTIVSGGDDEEDVSAAPVAVAPAPPAVPATGSKSGSTHAPPPVAGV